MIYFFRTLRYGLVPLLFLTAGLPLSSQVIIEAQVEEAYPEYVDVHLVAYSFEQMLSMQFSLEFNPAEVVFFDAINLNLPGLGSPDINPVPGKVVAAWLAMDLVNGTTVPDGFSMVTLRFTPLVPGACSFVFDPESPIQAEFYNVNGLLTYQFIDCDYEGGILSGNLFFDEDDNCGLSSGEPMLGRLMVGVESDGNHTYARVNEAGQYRYFIKPNDDSLNLKVIAPNDFWGLCPAAAPVGIADPSQDISHDLPLQALELCPQAVVELFTPFLRLCDTARYSVSFGNAGTLPLAGAEVIIDFDAFLEVTGSSVPWSEVTGNAYTFPVGDIAVGEWDSYWVDVLVSCDASLGQLLCTEAAIKPVEFCNPSPAWSGAWLEVEGICEGNEVVFEIRNAGSGDMDAPSAYLVIEDDLIVETGTVGPLNVGGMMQLQFPATGATWRVEVAQVADFPGESHPCATVEACDADGGGQFSTGFAGMFPQDENAPYLAVDCRPVIGSFDPNDKTAFPEGYRSDHFIAPDTRLEYLIRFQNTGIDTAFRVVIRDTLSQWLDPVSFQLFASSHPCEVQILPGNRLAFDFPGVLLPDSTTNEPASHGFVQFSIDQRPGNPLGELIENRAGIYFDYNVPVITNTVFHTLGADFVEIVNGLSEAGGKLQRLKAWPNPASASVWIGLPGDGMLRLFDQAGRELRVMKVQEGAFQLERNGREAGLYWLVWEQEGKAGGIVPVTFR
jgi:hypothetical protein